MMTADDRHVTGGVDTHGEIHVAAVLDSATARRLAVAEFRADTAGYVALREWMTEHVYQHGRRYTRNELLERATGRPLDPAPYMAHLTVKYSTIYGL